MTRSARATRLQLNKLNRQYLALRARQSQDARVFRFDPTLAGRITWVRNDIIELQATLRKEVNHTV